MSRLRKILCLICIVVVAIGAVACRGGAEESAKERDSAGESTNVAKDFDKFDQPVTLKIMNWGTGDNPSLNQFIADAQKHFPNLTIQLMPYVVISNAVVTGDLPDIMFGRPNLLPEMAAVNLQEDITPLAKKYNYDLSAINQKLLQKVKNAVGGQILPGLPGLALPGNVLYYNKDLFNRFGVAYPQDGMTWDQVYNLAVKLNRDESGIHYSGYLDRWSQTFLADYASILGLRPVAQNEDTAALSDPGWGRLIQQWQKFFTLPGNTWDSKNLGEQEVWQLFPKGVVAMMVKPKTSIMNEAQFDWDIVTAPSFPEQPGVNSVIDGQYAFILKTSQNQDAAFKMLAFMESRNEQIQVTRNGNMPVLNDPAILKEFAVDAPDLKGKNVKAFINAKYAEVLPPRAPGLSVTVESKALSLLTKEVMNIILKSEDINTTLRNATEQINSYAKTEANK